MPVEIRGIYNNVERSLLLDMTDITGSQEIRDLLAGHFQVEDAPPLRQPLAHVDAIAAYCQELFGETFWRSDALPEATAPAVPATPAPAAAAVREEEPLPPSRRRH